MAPLKTILKSQFNLNCFKPYLSYNFVFLYQVLQISYYSLMLKNLKGTWIKCWQVWLTLIMHSYQRKNNWLRFNTHFCLILFDRYQLEHKSTLDPVIEQEWFCSNLFSKLFALFEGYPKTWAWGVILKWCHANFNFFDPPPPLPDPTPGWRRRWWGSRTTDLSVFQSSPGRWCTQIFWPSNIWRRKRNPVLQNKFCQPQVSFSPLIKWGLASRAWNPKQEQ